MEDTEEIDILGDFDYKTSCAQSNPEDDAELPSNSVQLIPEFSQHPWVLEQGWSLDHCADVKSRAALEKMLQEEQLYTDGKVTKYDRSQSFEQPKPSVPSYSSTSASSRKKTLWLQEEKDLFYQGLEIYGRRWCKIAELIPSKTHQQVKNFALHHLKRKVLKKPGRSNSSDTDAIETSTVSLEETLTMITTGAPTVPVLSPRGKGRGRPPKLPKSGSPEEDKTAKALFADSHVYDVSRSNLGILANLAETEIVRIRPREISESEDEEIDIELDSDEDNLLNTLKMKEKINDATKTESVSVNATNTETKLSDSLKTESDVDDLSSRNTGVKEEDTTEEVEVVLGSPLTLTQKEEPDDSSVGANSSCCSTITNSVKTESAGEIKSETETSLENPKTLPNIQSDVANIEPDQGCSQTEDEHISSEDSNQQNNQNQSPTILCSEETSNIVSSSEEIERNEQSEGNDASEEPEDDYEDDHPNEFALFTSNGEVVYIPNPTCEVTLNRQEVMQEEQHFHAEFFDGRPGMKTVERYLRIRNHILDSWEKCRPSYLKKTSARVGLKNCGDVNCIGRIHSYLEQIGAINFGCEQAQYNQPVYRPVPKTHRVRLSKELKEAMAIARMESMRPRKRRVKDAFGEWIDERDLEGKTIEHGQAVNHKEKPEEAKKRKPRNTGDLTADPFKLVPCSSFDTDHPAPFSVTIDNTALGVMDVHSHLSKTEVIGLLGGRYYRDRATLDVMSAEPCDSFSTGIQCDMNPVSQTEASERIHSANQQVVGWYHSHPMFDANPSVRDMETQLEFQEWFAKGGAPFIGIIVSPYNKQRSSLCSDVRCLTVKQQGNSGATRTPYQFEFSSYQNDVKLGELEGKIQDLVKKYVNYANRVELLRPFRSLQNMSAMEKMLRSLQLYLVTNKPEDSKTDNGAATIQDKIRRMITDSYGNE